MKKIMMILSLGLIASSASAYRDIYTQSIKNNTGSPIEVGVKFFAGCEDPILEELQDDGELNFASSSSCCVSEIWVKEKGEKPRQVYGGGKLCQSNNISIGSRGMAGQRKKMKKRW